MSENHPNGLDGINQKGKWPLPVGSRAQESWFRTRWAVDPFYYNRIMSGMDGWAMTSISTYLCVHLEIGWDMIKMLYDLCFQFYWSPCMNNYRSLIVKCISHMTTHTIHVYNYQPEVLWVTTLYTFSTHTRTQISNAGFRIGWATKQLNSAKQHFSYFWTLVSQTTRRFISSSEISFRNGIIRHRKWKLITSPL